jgi:hypothetical protein
MTSINIEDCDKLYHLYGIYDAFINYGYVVRKTNKSGYDAWHLVKKEIPEETLTWTTSAQGYYGDLTTGVYSLEDVTPVDLQPKAQLRWERNYFLLQHGRIIKKYPTASLVKLFQIAYNTGQFIADNEIEPYPQTQLGYFLNKQLNKLTSFVTPESLKKVDAKVYIKIYDALHNIVIGPTTMISNKKISTVEVVAENLKNATEVNEKLAKNTPENFKEASEKKKESEKAKEKDATSSEAPKSVTDSATSSPATTPAPLPAAAAETSTAAAPTEAAASPTSTEPAPTPAPEVKKGGNSNSNYKVHFSDYLKALKKENSYY